MLKPTNGRPRGTAPTGGLSVREVAALTGLSRSLVSQIEQKALAKLRRDPILRQLAADTSRQSESAPRYRAAIIRVKPRQNCKTKAR